MNVYLIAHVQIIYIKLCHIFREEYADNAERSIVCRGGEDKHFLTWEYFTVLVRNMKQYENIYRISKKYETICEYIQN